MCAPLGERGGQPRAPVGRRTGAKGSRTGSKPSKSKGLRSDYAEERRQGAVKVPFGMLSALANSASGQIRRPASISRAGRLFTPLRARSWRMPIDGESNGKLNGAL